MPCTATDYLPDCPLALAQVAYLAAANNFKADHATKNWDLVEAARVVYCTGFFITGAGTEDTPMECVDVDA